MGTQSILEFLEALFTGQVLLWHSHSGGGGWRRLGTVVPNSDQWREIAH